MPPCAESGCVAIATRGDRCPVHSAGLHKHHIVKDPTTDTVKNPLRCATCERAIRDGEWYRQDANAVRHAHDCGAVE